MNRARLLLASLVVAGLTLWCASPVSAQSCSLPAGSACPAGCATCFTASVNCRFTTACVSGGCPADTVQFGVQSCGAAVDAGKTYTCVQFGSAGTGICQTCVPGRYGVGCNACPDCHSGTCSDGISGNGTCSCPAGVTGPACEFSNLTTCSGHGVATFFGMCVCDAGSVGSNCGACAANRYGPSCLACPGGALSACSGVGTCTGDGACVCKPGYSGSDCSDPAILSPAFVGPTTGLDVLTIFGAFFGATPGSVSIGGAACQVQSWTTTTISCVTPPGQGTGLPLVVTTAAAVASAPKNYGYFAPAIFSISPVHAALAAGTVLTIKGRSFGQTPSVTVGSAPCVFTAPITDEELKCTLPAASGVQPVQVTVAGQPSNTVSFTYDPLSCTPGRHVDDGACAICPAGAFSAGGTLTSCTACAAGTFAASAGSGSCTPCAAGTYADAPGSSVCTACAAGTASTVGASACVEAATLTTLALRAECIAIDPLDSAKRIARFGYENGYGNAGEPLARPYGADNRVTIGGQDAGPFSGAPPLLAVGIRSNVFGVRFTPGQTVTWSVRDPQSQLVVSATSATAAACDPAAGPQGEAGLQGPPGAPGPAGAQGAAGPVGLQGPIGDTGPQGPIGQTGAQGPVGEAGPQGSIGPAGSTGVTGVGGATGPIGPAGSAGPSGQPGAQGPEGPRGSIGQSGPEGPQGAAGLPGLTGPQGPRGDTGAAGPSGSTEYLPARAILFVVEGELVPPGFSYIGSFKMNASDKGAASVTIRMYRKDS